MHSSLEILDLIFVNEIKLRKKANISLDLYYLSFVSEDERKS